MVPSSIAKIGHDKGDRLVFCLLEASLCRISGFATGIGTVTFLTKRSY